MSGLWHVTLGYLRKIMFHLIHFCINKRFITWSFLEKTFTSSLLTLELNTVTLSLLLKLKTKKKGGHIVGSIRSKWVDREEYDEPNVKLTDGSKSFSDLGTNLISEIRIESVHFMGLKFHSIKGGVSDVYLHPCASH